MQPGDTVRAADQPGQTAFARVGRRLEAGWVVLSGEFTAPVPLRPGTNVIATISGLGSVMLGAD
jgi:2-keto-4-pentenoate hydratase